MLVKLILQRHDLVALILDLLDQRLLATPLLSQRILVKLDQLIQVQALSLYVVNRAHQ